MPCEPWHLDCSCQVEVAATMTNHVTDYHTNWSMLNLTNWQTLVLFKTNWLTQAMTNVVQIDLPSSPVVAAAAPSEVVEPNEAPVPTATPALTAAWTGPLVIEAARTSQPPANDLVEVQMKVKRTDNTDNT